MYEAQSSLYPGAGRGPAAPLELDPGLRRGTTCSADAIGIARLICILGMVYVHAWTGLGGSDLVASAETEQGLLRWTLIELVGRSAVPLLGMISGWLAAGSIARRPWGTFVAGKARTLILPMLLWNALALLLVSGGALAGLLLAPVPQDAWWIVNEMTAITRPNDINVQMPFLRDLFVCMIAAPLLARLPSAWIVALAGVVAVWVIGGWHLFVLLRPQIFLFFLIGLLARRHGWVDRVADIALARAALPFLILAPAMIALSVWSGAFGEAHRTIAAGVDLAGRLTAALLFWRIATGLARTAAAPLFRRLEPYAFPLFCSHLIVIWLTGPLMERIVGPLGSPLYPVALLLHPMLLLGAAIGFMRMLEALSPSLAALMSGGRHRVPSPPASRPVDIVPARA